MSWEDFGQALGSGGDDGQDRGASVGYGPVQVKTTNYATIAIVGGVVLIVVTATVGTVMFLRELSPSKALGGLLPNFGGGLLTRLL